jgi:hypothetical protein
VKGTVTQNKAPAEVEIEVSYANATKHYGVYRSNATSGNYMLNLPLGEKYKLTFKHKTLGEKFYQVSTLDVSEYAEKIINVNFKDGEIAKTEKANIVAITNKDTVSFAKKTKVADANVKAGKIETTEVKGGVIKAEIAETAIAKTEKFTEEKTTAAVSKKEKIEKNSAAKTNSKPVKEAKLLEEASMISKSKTEKEPSVTETKNSCGSIKTNHDADFIYRKCENVWYTKSKSHPYSKYAKGFFKEWTSLADNPKANERLNGRYARK